MLGGDKIDNDEDIPEVEGMDVAINHNFQSDYNFLTQKNCKPKSTLERVAKRRQIRIERMKKEEKVKPVRLQQEVEREQKFGRFKRL